jgi:hypothetical protein
VDLFNFILPKDAYLSVSDPESKGIVIGPNITYRENYIQVTDFRKHIEAMLKLQSLLVVNRFVYKWIKTFKMKKWLLTWSITPYGWETQEMLKGYMKFSRTKIRAIKRVHSAPIFAGKIKTYHDLNYYINQ